MDRFTPVLAAGALALAALVSSSARAATVRGDGRVVVPLGETVHDDLYVFGGQAEIHGTVDGDLAVFGGQVDVTGPVTRDLFVGGGNVTVSGKVGGTARVAGGNAVIQGDVGRDLLFAGGSMVLRAGSTVAGDVLVGSGEARIDGTVGRDLKLGAGEVTLLGTVGRNVGGRAAQLTLGAGSRVNGDVRLESPNEITRDPGAQVGGSVVRTAPTAAEGGPTPAAWVLLQRLRRFLGALTLGLLLVLLFPWFSKQGLTKLRERPWADLGIGVAFAVGAPAVGILVGGLGWLIAGWWVGALFFGAWLLALGVGYVLASAGLGRWVLERFGRPGVHPALALLLGLVLLILLGTVPILGPAVAIIAVLFGTGALARAIAEAYRRHGTAAETASG